MPREAVSNEDLERIARRVREHRRRALLAKGIGAALTFAGLLIGLALSFALGHRALLWGGLLAGGAIGAFAYQRLEPRDLPDDL